MRLIHIKDPNSLNDPFHAVWCSRDGANTNSSDNTGTLSGATIVTSTWIVPSGLTEASETTSAIQIQGISYDINTVSTIYLDAGTSGKDYNVVNRITTSDSPSRTLDHTIIVRVKET